MEDDRNCPSCRLCRGARSIPPDCGNHRYLSANEIGGQFRQPLVVVFGPAVFDRDVATFDKACFVQTAAERRQLRRISLRRCRSNRIPS